MAPSDPTSAATMTGVVRRFRTGADVVTALDGVDLTAAASELTVVAGPSGSGKSTLLSLLWCDGRPDAGTIYVAGVDTTALGSRARRRFRRTIGVVLPQPSDNLLDRHDVAGNFAWAGRVRRSVTGSVRAVEHHRLLDVVGLPTDVLDKRPRQLSGGEQQRVAIALALVGTPRLLVADEPTASLDAESAATVVAALRAAAAEGAAVVVASHDPAVMDAADQLVHLHEGRRVQ